MKNTVVVVVVAAVLVLAAGGGGFFAGMQVGRSQAASAAGARFGRFGGQFGNRGFGGFGGPGGPQGGFRQGTNGTGFVVGKVIAKDSSSITVSLPQGGSKTVYVDKSTRVSKIGAGTLADISVGTTVTAAGTTGSDGSITGRTVTIEK